VLDFLDRVLVVAARIWHVIQVVAVQVWHVIQVVAVRVWHGVLVTSAWIAWAAKVVAHVARHFAPVVAPHFRAFGRPVVLVVAGLFIPFIANHGNIVGLVWLTTISTVSLAVRDDCTTLVTKAVWWINAIFTGASALGLILGTIGPASALSLAIPLVLFECARAFIRSEPLAGWTSAALALALAIIVFPSRTDSTMATGLIGAWAIIVGVFAAISRSEILMSTGKKVLHRVTQR
jgi:hypothetical protein